MRKVNALRIINLTLGFMAVSLAVTPAGAEDIRLLASKAEYFQRAEESPSGMYIYPVRLTWELPGEYADDTGMTLILYAAPDAENAEPSFIEISRPGSAQKEFFHHSENFIPNQKWLYKLSVMDSSGREISSATDYGWGALSHALYFITYDSQIKKSHSRLTLMNKPGNWNKLGKEKITGLFSGTLGYATSVQLSTLSGVVKMPYTNYSDFPGWILTGSMDTRANISGNGKMSGTMSIEGMYPGSVCYDDLVLRDSRAGGGTYIVSPQGAETKSLDYEITFYGDNK